MEDHFGRQIAELRREITPAQIREDTAQNHLDRLFSEMGRLGLRQAGTADAARILGISARQMAKVKPLVSEDHRFVLVVDPRIHKQRQLIRIV
jgi:hypothetical protein